MDIYIRVERLEVVSLACPQVFETDLRLTKLLCERVTARDGVAIFYLGCLLDC